MVSERSFRQFFFFFGPKKKIFFLYGFQRVFLTQNHRESPRDPFCFQGPPRAEGPRGALTSRELREGVM